MSLSEPVKKETDIPGTAIPATLPNILSLFRIAAAPFLILSGWLQLPVLFFLLFGLMFLSDAVDGYLARKLHLSSKLGAKLDSLGDISTYLSIPPAVWWLWPDIITDEAAYIIAAILIYIAPALFSLAKFGELASYHTLTTKISAVLMSSGLFLLLAFQLSIVFHTAVLFLILEALENMAITHTLSAPRSDVRSYWQLLDEEKNS